MLAGAAVFLADLECAPRLTVRHVEHACLIGRPGGVRLLRSAAPGRDFNLAARRGRLLNSDALRRYLRVGVAAAGLGLVMLTGLSARWVGQQAELAQLDPQSLAFPEPDYAPAPAERLAEIAPPSLLAPSTGDAAPGGRSHSGVSADGRDGTADDAPGGALGEAFEANVSVARAGPEERRSAGDPQAFGDPGVTRALGAASRALAVSPASLGSFAGPVSNETLRLTGKLSLDVSRDGPSGAVRAKFHAWNGLLGTGELQGTMAQDGRVVLTGQLLMGKNPFLCTLTGTIYGDHFTGTAQFVRPWGGRIAHSSFSLFRT